MPFHPTSFELLVCYLNTAVGKFILVNVYQLSSHNITEAFFEDLTSLLEIISTYSSMIVLVGDFNIHVNDSYDVMALHFLDLIDAFGLVQHVTGPTHARGHTLDLVITAPNYAPTDISTDRRNIISDHGLTTCQLRWLCLRLLVSVTRLSDNSTLSTLTFSTLLYMSHLSAWMLRSLMADQLVICVSYTIMNYSTCLTS